MNKQPPTSAEKVFLIPELLEAILLSLPSATIHQELSSQRTILLSQTTPGTWHLLLKASSPLRQFLYRPTQSSLLDSRHIWNTKHPFPPARPNNWIPTLILQQRSWGSAWPVEISSLQHDLRPSQPRLWTFSLEISERQHRHLTTLPSNLEWRSMLASDPPFTSFWSTRTFYELGSGRAPFVQWLDYDLHLPKRKQKFYRSRDEGVTLGDLVDVVKELFEFGGAGTRFVMVESVRLVEGDGKQRLGDDRPGERGYMPGMSAREGAGGWYD